MGENFCAKIRGELIFEIPKSKSQIPNSKIQEPKAISGS
jgi:hypothetical protein